ncbi:MAG: hypothetical protein L6V81_10305 [Clostridium sp.]|nr:MAG: hypothetical protein L6V81_10305 [Clostridium sp.]
MKNKNVIKSKFKLEIFIIILSISSILIHLYKIIFRHDKLTTELILTLVVLFNSNYINNSIT